MSHRRLIRQFARRYIEMRHKGSLFGVLWSVLNPLLVLAVYSFVFVIVFRGSFGVSPSESRWDYAIGIFIGLAISQLFLEALTASPQLIVSNPNYVKKVVFPLEILPVSATSASLFHCVVSLALALLATALAGNGLHAGCLWLPVLLVPVLFMSLGAAWLMAALGVFLRDLTFITQFLNLVIMFLSGVFYSPQRIPEAYGFLRWNPLLIAVDVTRNAVLWNMPPALDQLLYLYAVGIMSLCGGYILFTRLKPAFADVV